MAPHIVSWGWNEVKIAPVVTNGGTPSVVPIESLLSDPNAKSPIIIEASTTESAATPASFLGVETCGSTTPDGSRLQSNDYLRHSKYFFKDGNVTFLVDGFLYCVHRYFFSRDSVYFSSRFTQLGVRDHEASSTTVSLGDVKRKDFEAFLSVLYPEDFEEHDLSYEQWRSVLHLSTRWGFASLRKLALRSINPPTSYDRLVLARTYAVDDWILPALTALCERKAPLSLDEARGLSIEDVVLVATVREDIRSTAIRPVRAASISRRIEAMQVGTPVPAAGNEVSSASPTPGATEKFPVYATACPSEDDIGTAELAGGETPMSGWSPGWNFVSSGRR
ncbi:hypothetical protein EDB92DRAFT_1539508 [Lactarius akahatsu]|uniref:BTB domain-containing protein n=1 Tax=Lactarius akahatsu TaxID=416441 RepID=A0AAD4QGB5_9AGAM|nr:hypothetical protein EDB92DRAFT_1539508 [Lactarius akahatsu]